MRELYTQQLMTMKTRLIQMGAMCEDAISCSVKGMLNGDAELLKKVESTEMDINQMEREIERLCMRLLLMQQPVASDLRSVSSALKIISDLERIGDQAYDIAEIAKYLKYSEFAGKVQLRDTKKKREVIVTDPESGESKTYLIPYGSRIKITDGQILEAGDELTEGSVNPHDILRIKGVRAVQDYMIREVQRVYRLQGVEISDKHIEVIVRQMLKKIRIEDNGDTEFLPGTLVDFLEYEDVNEQMEKEGKQPADGKQVMLGITKASLATNSFLSAASFQETTKVLTEAAIKGKVDPLIGLKENVIIGKLIPAGTGMKRYRDVRLNSTMPEPEVNVEDMDEELPEDEEIKDDEMITMDEELPEDEEFDVEESDEEEAAEDEADDQAEALDDTEDNE